MVLIKFPANLLFCSAHRNPPHSLSFPTLVSFPAAAASAAAAAVPASADLSADPGIAHYNVISIFPPPPPPFPSPSSLPSPPTSSSFSSSPPPQPPPPLSPCAPARFFFFATKRFVQVHLWIRHAGGAHRSRRCGGPRARPGCSGHSREVRAEGQGRLILLYSCATRMHRSQP